MQPEYFPRDDEEKEDGHLLKYQGQVGSSES